MVYKILWTQEAIDNLETILSYLAEKWTTREVVIFKKNLSKQLELIKQFPKMFPVSSIQPRLRKSVLSKQTSILYEIKDDTILLAYIFNSKMSDEVIK